MKKYWRYVVPCIITFIILSIIFYINGLYPYGNYSMVEVDADYQYIPVLYRIYDFLHGCRSIIYDDIGFGNNIYISMVIQGSIFSPVNLLLYFTSRNNIVNYFNILVIIKMCLISLTMYIYINNKFKISYFYKVLGSILYTFCGFILLNYFNIMWLDCVILFPLIMMYLDRLINNDKYVGYIICLSISLIISYYISYFILVYILFYSFIYINLYVDKDKKKRVVYKLGVSTFISLLIASFSLLPSIYQMFISSRFSSISDYPIMSDTMIKSLYILFSPLLVILFILLISKYNDDKKNVYFYLVLFGLFSIGILVEPINISIHGGSYWDFPYRYGFITSFILLSGGLYYIEKFDFVGNNKYVWIKILLVLVFGGLLIYFSKEYLNDIVGNRIFLDFDNINIYLKIVIIILIIMVLNIISLSINNKYFRYLCLGIVNVGSVLLFSLFTMFYNEGYYLSYEINKINNNMNILGDGRYKVDYKNYTPDYGFILDVDTLDNWIHLIPSSEIDIYEKLGYLVSGTSVKSYGGTIFSDWLFNIRYVISDKIKDNDMYEFIDGYDGKYLYKYKYSYNYGVVYNDNELIDMDSFSRFEFQNIIYRNLIDQDNDIIKIDNYFMFGNDIYVDYEINDKGILYIDIGQYDRVNYIEINGNYIYDIENYICDLGVYDENVLIHINIKDDELIDFELGYIKLDDILKLDSVVKYIDDNYYIDDISNSKNLFLPVNNIDGINIYLNDKNVDSDKYLDNFISVKLENGDNVVSIKYNMPLFKLGIILSIVGIILLILFKNIKPNYVIDNIMYYLYLLFIIGLFIYYYCYSMIKCLKI